ncbi:MAG: hypothetical protein Q7S32_01735 [bacterium]|nr:hypothetical protein [bacterium]
MAGDPQKPFEGALDKGLTSEPLQPKSQDDIEGEEFRGVPTPSDIDTLLEMLGSLVSGAETLGPVVLPILVDATNADILIWTVKDKTLEGVVYQGRSVPQQCEIIMSIFVDGGDDTGLLTMSPLGDGDSGLFIKCQAVDPLVIAIGAQVVRIAFR